MSVKKDHRQGCEKFHLTPYVPIGPIDTPPLCTFLFFLPGVNAEDNLRIASFRSASNANEGVTIALHHHQGDTSSLARGVFRDGRVFFAQSHKSRH